MTTFEERLSRLEGGYEHLATKADLAELRTDFSDLRTEFANLKTQQATSEARMLRWVVGLMGTTALTVIASIIVDFIRT